MHGCSQGGGLTIEGTTLRWNQVDSYDNGDPLDPATVSYIVYYGSGPDPYLSGRGTVTIDAGTTSYDITRLQLTPGDNVFCVTAVDPSGIASLPSRTVKTTI